MRARSHSRNAIAVASSERGGRSIWWPRARWHYDADFLCLYRSGAGCQREANQRTPGREACACGKLRRDHRAAEGKSVAHAVSRNSSTRNIITQVSFLGRSGDAKSWKAIFLSFGDIIIFCATPRPSTFTS